MVSKVKVKVWLERGFGVSGVAGGISLDGDVWLCGLVWFWLGLGWVMGKGRTVGFGGVDEMGDSLCSFFNSQHSSRFTGLITVIFTRDCALLDWTVSLLHYLPIPFP